MCWVVRSVPSVDASRRVNSIQAGGSVERVLHDIGRSIQQKAAEVGTVFNMFLGDPGVNRDACGMAYIRRQVVIHGCIIMSEVDGDGLGCGGNRFMEIRLKILPSEAKAWIRW